MNPELVNAYVRFYRILSLLTRWLGPWFFSLIAGGIAAGYFILFPKRVAVGMRFYQALFPKKAGLITAGAPFASFWILPMCSGIGCYYRIR